MKKFILYDRLKNIRYAPFYKDVRMFIHLSLTSFFLSTLTYKSSNNNGGQVSFWYSKCRKA